LMWFFEDEQTEVARRMGEMLPQLHDIGTRGATLANELRLVTNVVTYPTADGQGLFGSDEGSKAVELKMEKIGGELHTYEGKWDTAVRDLTKILTETR
jgi:hypothetical protein